MMIYMLRIIPIVLGCCLLIGDVQTAFGQESGAGRSNYYWLDASVFSIDETDVLTSYEGYKSGGTGPSSSLIFGVTANQRKFLVKIAATQENRRFKASLKVQPDKKDKSTKARDEQFDLTDLESRTIDLGKDDDGRVYRVRLVPHVRQHAEPKRFRLSDFGLNDWHFQDSAVILNDQEYLGTLSLGGGEVAWIDVPGLAKVEFSLLPFKGAKSEGVLKGGTVRLERSDGTQLRITNVRNGFTPTPLPGGPFQVWVRWSNPSESIEEYRDSLKRHIQELRERSKRGDVELSKQTLERLEKATVSGGAIRIEGGVSSPKKNDLGDQDSTSK